MVKYIKLTLTLLTEGILYSVNSEPPPVLLSPAIANSQNKRGRQKQSYQNNISPKLTTLDLNLNETGNMSTNSTSAVSIVESPTIKSAELNNNLSLDNSTRIIPDIGSCDTS